MWIDFLNQINFGEGLVIDRMMGSEIAYGFAYERFFDDEYACFFDEKLCNLNAVVIYCHKDYLTEKDFNDDIIKFDKIARIKEGYKLYFGKYTKMPFLSIETSDQNLAEQIKKIKTFLQETC